MDSVTLLHHEKERIALAVTFLYGSNHNAREAACARANCEKLGIEYLEIPLKFIGEYFHSSLLEGAEYVPEGRYDDASMKSTVVPFRNGIMLAVACGMAESYGLRHVLIANHGGDHTIYPDCRPEFINSMSAAMQYGTYEHVDIIAPFTDITKTDIAAIGRRAGVDFAMTYSCYKGGEKHCGKCGTCVERREALAEAGIDDPTEYEED